MIGYPRSTLADFPRYGDNDKHHQSNKHPDLIGHALQTRNADDSGYSDYGPGLCRPPKDRPTPCSIPDVLIEIEQYERCQYLRAQRDVDDQTQKIEQHEEAERHHRKMMQREEPRKRVVPPNALQHDLRGERRRRLTKPNHPWTSRQVERMNRTIKEAVVKRFHFETHDQLRTHLADFMGAYNFAAAPRRSAASHPTNASQK
jgi:hypothetical protein